MNTDFSSKSLSFNFFVYSGCLLFSSKCQLINLETKFLRPEAVGSYSPKSLGSSI